RFLFVGRYVPVVFDDRVEAVLLVLAQPDRKVDGDLGVDAAVVDARGEAQDLARERVADVGPAHQLGRVVEGPADVAGDPDRDLFGGQVAKIGADDRRNVEVDPRGPEPLAPGE